MLIGAFKLPLDVSETVNGVCLSSIFALCWRLASTHPCNIIEYKDNERMDVISLLGFVFIVSYLKELSTWKVF